MQNILIFILVTIFGSSSWLSLNSVWMELPLMTSVLPEGWDLPSYLTIIIQIACVTPLAYTILHKCTKVSIPKAPVILIFMLVVSVANLIFAFIWDKTAKIFGEQHSLALFVLMLFMSMINATSDVLYLPYLSVFYPKHLATYFVGMSISELVPSLIALVQGSSNYICEWNNGTDSYKVHYTQPKFGIKAYNLIIFGWLCMTIVAFVLLHWGRHLIVQPKRLAAEEHTKYSVNGEENRSISTEKKELHIEESVISIHTTRETTIRYYIFLGCQLILNVQMNGVLPSVSTFATLPYSPKTYHLAITLSYGARPLGSFLALWMTPKKVSIFLSLTVLTSLLCGFVVLVAAQSPHPLLQHSTWGEIIAVTIRIGLAIGQSYLRSAITDAIREDFPNNEAKIFWCGLSMQIGSFIGSTIMFPLTNVWHLFKDGSYC